MKREKFEELMAVVDAKIVAKMAENNEWSEAGRKMAEANELEERWKKKWINKEKPTVTAEEALKSFNRLKRKK